MMITWDASGVAQGIDEVWEAANEVQFRKVLAEWIGPPKEGKLDLLDVGCGSARMAPLLSAYVYYGVDWSEEMLCIARTRVTRLGALARYDITKGLPYPAACFDTVLCNQVLRHMPYVDVLKVLPELIRLSGGRVFIVDGFHNGLEHHYSETKYVGQTFPDNSWSMSLFLEDIAKLCSGSWQIEVKQLLEWVCGVGLERK